MIEIRAPGIEDAVIRLCTAHERVRRIVVDTCASTFLAYNTLHGYSQIDFRRPERGKLKELAELLALHADCERTDRLYSGLYLDMIHIVDPEVEIYFDLDGVLIPGRAPSTEPEAPRAAPSALPRRVGVGAALARAFGSARAGRPEVLRQQSASSAGNPPALNDHHAGAASLALVAFGDSNVYGNEISEVELGCDDPAYRAERCYPPLLAKALGIQFAGNFAEPGRGNNKIFRRLCDFIAARRHELSRYFFVIGLTHPGRKGFVLKDGGEYLFVDNLPGMEPWILRPVCVELFYPPGRDQRMNEEIEHKYWVLTCFLRKLGCHFVVVPGWDFAHSESFFRDKDLGREGAFFFGPKREKFGFHTAVAHLPIGPGFHPLSEAHAQFSIELAQLIRERGLI